MNGKIYKSTGSWYVIKTKEQEFWNGRLRGTLKIDGFTSSNPLAVGDLVDMEEEDAAEKSAIITAIHDRKNYIIRQSPSNRFQHNIIAANIDLTILLATLKEPRTSQGFIDRFLVTSEAYHIPSVIVLNKSDIYGKKEMEKYEAWQEMYSSIGYKLLLISVAGKMGLDQIQGLLKDKVSLISGHSGVGKSSFINVILPARHLKTQDVSDWSGKGMHTTTFAEMFDLPEGGQLIDTPGIREFGIVDIPKQELGHYFPEMRDRLVDCQFNNCLHITEPGCAIKKALSEGEIFEDRYISYCKILDSIDEKIY
ncbi:MAG: ribosome small subunit-dependent GTPase A [Chitinophagales bacterium]